MDKRKNQIKTNEIVLTGLMTALVAVATIAIMIPVPFTGGYIHLGDSMIFLSVLLLGWKKGGFAAGVGSMLADIITGYVIWAPWTLVIKGLMAVLMGLAIDSARKDKKNIISISAITAGAWLAFNFVISKIITVAHTSDPNALVSGAELEGLNQLPSFIQTVQSQIMIGALLIPIALGLIVLYIKKSKDIKIPIYQIVAMTLSGLWMVFGYYVAAGIIYGNFAVSAFSVPWNMLQFVIGFLISAIIYALLLKTPAKKYFKIQM